MSRSDDRIKIQGRLSVIGEAGRDEQGRRLIRVECECGAKKVVLYRSFNNNKTQSCGCLRIERIREVTTTHGHTSPITPEYEAWKTMISRCYTGTVESYPYYGGMGIRVCKQWRDSFETFLEDVGFRPSADHLLCLLDKSADFKPGNAKWLTRFEADRKKRNNTFYTVNGVTKCLVDWAAEHNIPKNTLHYRVVTKGMTMRDALDVGKGRQGRALV